MAILLTKALNNENLDQVGNMRALRKQITRIKQQRLTKARSHLELVRHDEAAITKQQSQLRAWLGTILVIIKAAASSGLFSYVWTIIEPYWMAFMRWLHHLK